MDITVLIQRAAAVLNGLLAERATLTEDLQAMRAAIDGGDTTVTAERVEAKVAERAAVDAKIDQARAEVERLEAEKARDDEVAELSQRSVPTGAAPAYDRVARVTAEERTYAAHKEPMFDRAKNQWRKTPSGEVRVAAGGSFARDVAAAFLGDFRAEDRLRRHMTEEETERGDYLAQYAERAVGTGAFAGLTVPQYLTDLWAPAVAASRPFADVCRMLPLPPDGMTVNISRITTATSVATQATENSPLSETNADDTLLTENVLTAGGQQTMSRQAIDRSTGAENVIMDDLFRRYATNCDSKLLNDATTGLTNVAQAVTYTDATPTAAELYPKLLNANANLEAVYLDQQVNRKIAIFHSRRWHWLQSQVGPNWPFMAQPNIPNVTGGVNFGAAYGSGFRGMLPDGTPVIVDNNIATNLGLGTNEDEIYVVNADECFLWEDPSAPMFIRAEQPAAASLGVLLVVFGYFAYSLRRYTNGQSKILGTGLITPTF